ncbi:hypothetical protein BZA70DRAFT_287425 [Myxozyma melibiosi]|uniref:TIGR02453 family protein n=1 Tax=Myxozyma melibiosi TaxID=54550 RepID=A0ABR1FE35_9ASCO
MARSNTTVKSKTPQSTKGKSAAQKGGQQQKPTAKAPIAKRGSSKKSTHSESEVDDDALDDDSDEEDGEESFSEFEEEDGEPESEEVSEEEVVSDDEEEETSKRRKGPSPRGTPKKKRKSTGGDDSADGFDGREIFIPKRAPRTDGGIPYKPNQLHPNTLLYIRELKDNNERDWFWDHEAEYRVAKKDFDEFVECLAEEMTKIDFTVPPLPVKDLTFRIHRDVRFSNDKTPYKPYFSAAFSRTGRSGHYAHYYVHVEPGNCRLAGGMWHLSESNNDGLRTMRRLIDRGGRRFKKVIEDPEMKKFFFRNPNKTPLEQFLEMNQGDALKKGPKDYPKDHKDLPLLCLRSYTVHSMLSDSTFDTGSDAVGKIIRVFKAMVPFVNFLNSVIMDNEDSEESGEEEEVEG